MFQSKSILVILLLAISQLAAAGTSHVNRASHSDQALKHRTNAARMAAGLGPLPPTELQRRTFGGGHSGGHGPGGWHNPPGQNPPGQNPPGHPGSPTQPNPPKPSPGPPGKPDCDDKHEVPIKCKRKDNGQHLGYVSKQWSKKGKRGFGVCANKDDALKVDFRVENRDRDTLFNIEIKGDFKFPYLGFAGNNLESGSGDSAVLTSTRQTNKGNSPSNVGNSFPGWSANSESQVWSYTRDNRSITSKWVNQGGISVESRMFYDPEDDLFHLVTDAGAFKGKYPNAYEVEFEIED